jgi:hypothetical protein
MSYSAKLAHPAERPIEQATEVASNFNLKTTKALGLVIPEALVARADAAAKQIEPKAPTLPSLTQCIVRPRVAEFSSI